MLVLSEMNLEPPNSSDINIIKISKNELKKYRKEPVQAIICSRGTAALISNMDYGQLKLIQLTSAGFDGVPLGRFRDRHIDVANAAGVYGIPIAETVVFTMLEIAKRYRRNPENRFPRLTRGYDEYISELYGKTVVILGVGNIGMETAKRLRGFGTRVIGFARHKKESNFIDKIIIDKEELLQNLGNADYIVSTLPDNEDSKHFISDDLIKSMNPHSYFINVGRQSSIDNEALYKALKEKKIQGAVLDMFEKIPNPITNKYRRLHNVIVLPGVAAVSEETNTRLRDFMLHNLQLLNSGCRPENIVN